MASVGQKIFSGIRAGYHSPGISIRLLSANIPLRRLGAYIRIQHIKYTTAHLFECNPSFDGSHTTQSETNTAGHVKCSCGILVLCHCLLVPSLFLDSFSTGDHRRRVWNFHGRAKSMSSQNITSKPA